jgi:hypothetical protein
MGLRLPGPQAVCGVPPWSSSNVEVTYGGHANNEPTNSWLSLCVLN